MSDDNLIDARQRFAAGGPPTAGLEDKDRDAVAKSIQQTRDRLTTADQIERVMRSRPRIPETDRPKLARNLGRMVETGGPEDIHALITALFESTFGREAAVSALKKRKRYLRLSADSLPPAISPGEYHASGADFVRLACTWAKINQSSHMSAEDARRQAVLNLAEGTSFDIKGGGTARRSEAGRVEFIERMNEVLARIEAAVDLDAYFDAACELPLNATVIHGGHNSIFNFEDSTRWHSLTLKERDHLAFSDSKIVGPSGEDEDEVGEGTNFLAPKVLLGFFCTPFEVNNTIPYKLAPYSPTHSKFPGDLIESLIVRYGAEHLPVFEKLVAEYESEIEAVPQSDLNDFESFSALHSAEKDCNNRLLERLKDELSLPEMPLKLLSVHEERIRKALIASHGPIAARLLDEEAIGSPNWWEVWNAICDDVSDRLLWAVRTVFLSIYRERSTGRARLVLTVSRYERVEYERVIHRFPRSASDRSFSPFAVGGDGSWDSNLCAVEWGLGDGYLVWDPDPPLTESSDEFAQSLLFLPGSKAMSLMMMPVGRTPPARPAPEVLFKPVFDDCPDGYAPARFSTIAGAILRNLAHAPAGTRLDELLLADARGKAKALRDLLEREEQAYRSGVKRLRLEAEDGSSQN